MNADSRRPLLALPFDVRKVYDLPGGPNVLWGFALYLEWQSKNFRSQETPKRFTSP
jgi:hypothetical protein